MKYPVLQGGPDREPHASGMFQIENKYSNGNNTSVKNFNVENFYFEHFALIKFRPCCEKGGGRRSGSARRMCGVLATPQDGMAPVRRH
jgi:hypothetical protein